MGYQYDYDNEIHYYTPSATQLERERKERAERALLNWSNLTFWCKSLKKNGLVIKMSEIILDNKDYEREARRIHKYELENGKEYIFRDYMRNTYLEDFKELAEYMINKKKREEEIQKYGYRPRAERHSLTERERELGYENVSQLYN